MAAGRRAVGVAGLRDAACEHRGVVGFADHDAGAGTLLLQDARHAAQRSAGAEAGDPVVERQVRERVQDLDGGGPRVGLGVGRILELPRLPPAVLMRQLLGFRDHSRALVRGRREHHPGAEKPHQLAALDAEALRHRDHQRIALLRANHGQPDAGVAAGRLDHGLTGPQRSAALGILDDTERQAILHRAHRIERLNLDEQLHVPGCELVDADDRACGRWFAGCRRTAVP